MYTSLSLSTQFWDALHPSVSTKCLYLVIFLSCFAFFELKCHILILLQQDDYRCVVKCNVEPQNSERMQPERSAMLHSGVQSKYLLKILDKIRQSEPLCITAVTACSNAAAIFDGARTDLEQPVLRNQNATSHRFLLFYRS